ncbi:Clan CD, family C14, metacaspase-like cysteine peptidase [Tritrichomonas foetus]|uniref:Clan CD, family C14, metacaspase-like cysteine peptidase n=1 Tax=Tritrichomonas foetus TaxID=1144522 RepID=A0A1J4J9R0_9EUKA|nr:Clan CD, family C14, metacaspase-like cysteine peptidase [Tritrichomonas foetus]|eukprot:OHS93980.1 Clan CD, family C14, metacaspase-like cysteine peptidase [Tritrichomonas foetus]
MGCGESAVDSSDVQIQERAVNNLNDGNFDKKQFQAARNALPIDAALQIFRKTAVDLTGKKPSALPSSMEKCCFICCNTYTKKEYELGVGPMNDSITVAENHKKRGYQVFFVHNPKPDEFLAFLGPLFKLTTKELTIFYTGHGANVKDRNGDESDGMDEAMVFDTGHIVDDKLVDVIIANANGKTRVLLLTDCCHSGSIWDLQSAMKHKKNLPANIISISAAKDSQTAKQTTIGKKSQGIFTYYFWDIVNKNKGITPKEIESKINVSLKKFNQLLVLCGTSKDMESKPLFA